MKNFVKRIINKCGFDFARVHKMSHAVRLTDVNVGRLCYYKNLLNLTKGIQGDIVECGVGQGKSFLMLAILLKIEKDERNLWGFDSFEGFPDPAQEDQSKRNPQRGDNFCSLQRINNMLRNHICDELFLRSRITLVKGFFEDSLNLTRLPKISLLNLDVDLYQSYKTCLEKLYPLLSRGGVVTFDEYLREEENFPGAKKAIDEFFSNKEAEFIKEKHYGKFYVIKQA